MRKLSLVLLVLVAMFAGWNCGGSGTSPLTRRAYVLLDPTRLGTYSLATGIPFGSSITLTTSIRNIAVRPTDDQLFGIGNDLKLYRINAINGDCTAVGNSALNIDGHDGGMTFIPGTGTIRFMTVNQNSYRINSTSGNIVNNDVDPNQAVVGLAVRQSTGEYFAYSPNDQIYKTVNPTAGVFTNVGVTGTDLSGALGMSIDNQEDIGYVVSGQGLYRFNFTSGTLTRISQNGGIDIAVLP